MNYKTQRQVKGSKVVKKSKIIDMAKQPSYFFSWCEDVPSMVKERFFHTSTMWKKIGKKPILSIEEGGEYFKEHLANCSSPFFFMRTGASEFSILHGKEKIEKGLAKDFKDKAKWAISVRAGIHPVTTSNLLEYAFLYEEALKEADAISCFGVHMERYFIKKDAREDAVLINGFATEPLLGMWSPALKGKKVLVISPFKEEIESQYKRREKIFAGEEDLLPFMDLRVVKPPYTLGEGDFPPFAEGVKKTLEECFKEPFDFALISAGGYAPLLGLALKKEGYSSFSVGGALQTLFGIMGHRWEKRSHVASRVNESWIRVKGKTPKGAEHIDGGAYW